MKKILFYGLLSFIIFNTSLFALRIAVEPLEKRVEKAEKIFVGKLINRVQDGEWVRAELLVDVPIHNVKKGDKVTKGQTLLIVEAMKVMNNISSPKSGIVEEIYVEDAQPIEYDQPLIVIK